VVAEVASGGGLISVQPAILDEMAGRFSGVAGSTGSVRGSVSGASGAADGCAGPVVSSFARAQALLDAALGALDMTAAGLSRATSAAAAAYVSTDNSLFHVGGAAAPPGVAAPDGPVAP
jgi:uncharacterized protein YukE